jgi:YHS domain-containing protein
MEVAMIEQPTMATDPVCGMTVEIEHARAAGLTSEREGQTYFFCGKGRRARTRSSSRVSPWQMGSASSSP